MARHARHQSGNPQARRPGDLAGSGTSTSTQSLGNASPAQGVAYGGRLWSTEKFREKTAGIDDAALQSTLSTMIDAYRSAYPTINTDNRTPALTSLREMNHATEWWLDTHVIADRRPGADAARPKERDSRQLQQIDSLEEFAENLDDEMLRVQTSNRGARVAATARADVDALKAAEVASPSAGLLALKGRFQGTASGFFRKMGDLAGNAAAADGDTAEIEGELKFPFDATASSWMGLKLKAGVETDQGQTKVRATLAVTGGAQVAQIGKIAGEVSGSVEAQATTAADAMDLISYGYYRRFRESHVLPRAATNYNWGGSSGDFGQKKSENWSLELEKRLFAIPDPVREPGDTDETWAAKQAEVADKRKGIYVELTNWFDVAGGAEVAWSPDGPQGMSGLDGKTSLNDMSQLQSTWAGVGEQEPETKVAAGVERRGGQRWDQQSLIKEKQGPGQANQLADQGWLSYLGSKVLGGERGAQKTTSRRTTSWTANGSFEVDPWAVGAQVGYVWSDGNDLPGQASGGQELDEAKITLTADRTTSLSAWLGPEGLAGTFLERVEEKLVKFLAVGINQASAGVAGVRSQLPSQQAMVTQILTDAGLRTVAAEAAERLDAESSGEGKYGMTLTIDINAGSASLELRSLSGVSVEIPKSLSIAKKTSSRLLRATWTPADGWIAGIGLG